MKATARQQASQELARYLQIYFREVAALSSLTEQLRDDPTDVFSRSNMRGHITTSALVIDPKMQLALLIHHKLSARWLQPGGHFEEPVQQGTAPQGSPLWQSALREVVEETAAAGVAPCLWQGFGALLPLDIDTHAIAARPSKHEAAHVHHDFVYLATADATAPLTAQVAEVFDARWVPLAHLAVSEDERLARIYRKLMALNQAGNVPLG